MAFLAVRFASWGEALTTGREIQGGDLYQLVRVEDFREPMPAETTTPPIFGAPPESTEILLIGDSHTRFARGGRSLARQLHNRFPHLRSVAAGAIHPRFYDPSDLLRLERVRPGRLKVVVVEAAERAVADVALTKIPQPFHAWDTTARFALVQELRDWNTRWFTGSEAGYQFLLLNSWLTRDLVESWNTTRFHVAKDLPGSIGAWRLPQGQLFLGEELVNLPPRSGETPTSFLQVRDSPLVEAVAASLADARDRLKANFGAQLVVLIVPAKASLLHRMLGFPYDGFVPAVDRALARRGIRSIDAWGALSALGDSAVLRTESHLSPTAYLEMADSISKAIMEADPAAGH
jgi:hypothetical protein